MTGQLDTNYYPSPAFSFWVAVASGSSLSLPEQSIAARFHEVSGIDAETKEVLEGGSSRLIHRLPGVKKHSNLVLQRGYVLKGSRSAQWASQTVGSTLGSPITTETLNVFLVSVAGDASAIWTFKDAWPVRWVVGTFDATDTKIVTDIMEFGYSSVSKLKP